MPEPVSRRITQPRFPIRKYMKELSRIHRELQEWENSYNAILTDRPWLYPTKREAYKRRISTLARSRENLEYVLSDFLSNWPRVQ